MIFVPTLEQANIIEADLVPQCVIACAGSGKTATAVRRLRQIRRRMGNSRGYALLLSYSNVAVDTFRCEYGKLSQESAGLSSRVRIETMDSFIATHILRPHAGRLMRAKRQPFLVSGREPFLAGFKWFDGQRPREVYDLTVSFTTQGDMRFVMRGRGAPVTVPFSDAVALLDRLGVVGAYTHDVGRYWALRTLAGESRLLDVLARRYPHIVVDEAQDVGTIHGALLEALLEAGSCVSLIGDPNQSIYEFADADGTFLKRYSERPGVATFPLSVNRRSLAPIVDVSNAVAGTKSTPIRQAGSQRHGAFFVRYEGKKAVDAVGIFESVLAAAGHAPAQAAVLCRGTSMVDRLGGGTDNEGVGATGHFVRAAVSRDRGDDIAHAFEETVSGVLRLVESPPQDLRRSIMANVAHPAVDTRMLRRMLWRFLRCANSGLPSATLKGSSAWLPLLKSRLDPLLASVEAQTGLRRSDTWTSNVTKAKLCEEALWKADLATTTKTRVRIDTVHKAKGEGIDAVMYLAKTDDINALLSGPGDEEGRIGYVALTRARDLFVLGVPTSAKPAVIDALRAVGFSLWTP